MNRHVCVCLVFLLGASLSSCATTNRVEPDDNAGVEDTGISSQDLRTVGQQMARSIIQMNSITSAENPPRIAFLPVQNNSNEIMDTDMFLGQIRTLLIKHGEGRLQFLDRERIDAIVREREAKRQGVVSAGSGEELAGADYFLTGLIESIEKASGHQRTAYFRLSFRLTDTESSMIVWEDVYEMKKAGSRAFWDR